MLIPKLTIYGVKLPPVLINDNQVQAFYEALTHPKFPTWLNHWRYTCWALNAECDFIFEYSTGFPQALADEHGTNSVENLVNEDTKDLRIKEAMALRREWVNHCIKYIEGEIPFANF